MARQGTDHHVLCCSVYSWSCALPTTKNRTGATKEAITATPPCSSVHWHVPACVIIHIHTTSSSLLGVFPKKPKRKKKKTKTKCYLVVVRVALPFIKYGHNINIPPLLRGLTGYSVLFVLTAGSIGGVWHRFPDLIAGAFIYLYVWCVYIL